MSWYKKGLKFGCTGCGKCCTGGPGYVWVTEEEITEMAAALKISVKEFEAKYTRLVDGNVSLKETVPNYDCIFLRDKKCLIYEARPSQCRTFPYWPENLESKQAWKETAERCEGIDHPDAPLVPLSEIQKNLDQME